MEPEGGHITFFTGVYSNRQEPLYAGFSPNKTATGQKWALTYIGSMNPQSTSSQNANHKSMNPQSTDPQSMNPQSTDPQSMSPQSMSSRSMSQKNTAPKERKAPETAQKKIGQTAGGARSKAQRREALLPPTLEEFAALPGITVGHLAELAPEAFPEGRTALSALEESYAKAVKEGTLYVEEQRASFFTGLYTEKGDPLHAGFVRNRFDDKPAWVLNFIGSDTFNPNLPEEQRRVVPGKKLENFAYLGNWNIVLEELASMALPEKWDFDFAKEKNHYILRQYLCYTFYRLQNEDKICFSQAGNFAAFNTGLVTRMYDAIYACFVPYEDPNYSTKWRLDGFCVAGERGSGKQLVKYFNPLPQAARYFQDLKDLFYDPGRELIVDYKHTLEDNISRLPMEFLIEQCYSDPEAVNLAKKAGEETGGQARGRLLRELRTCISSRPKLLSHLRYCLDEAVRLAIKKVRWDYNTALPLYFPTANCMSLMLPLSLLGNDRPDVALVVQLMESGNYQGQTILTLPQAYLDARLLCRPNSDWLNIDKLQNRQDYDDIEMDAVNME